MGAVAASIWIFNFGVVCGGYVVLLVCISTWILRQTSKTELIRLSALACALSLPLAWQFIYALQNGMPVKQLYIFTAFTEITWRPVMLWLALASLGCCAIARLLRGRKAVLMLLGGATVCAYTGFAQAIAGLFFANDIFRFYGFKLQY